MLQSWDGGRKEEVDERKAEWRKQELMNPQTAATASSSNSCAAPKI